MYNKEIPVEESFDDFYENSLTGYITTDPQGNILRCNYRLAHWLECSADEVKGKRISDLLTIGGKIYYETHLSPLLRMQGFFDEVALELLSSNGKKVDVLMNAYERINQDGIPQFIRLSVFKATDRRQYERNLRDAKATAEKALLKEIELSRFREQFIAVLGHDLRNPLGSIIVGASMLATSQLNDEDKIVVNILQRSGARMAELIENIVDFARARLGDGIPIDRKLVLLEPVFLHVIDELKTVWVDRCIISKFQLENPVNCDAPRLSQLVSNLLANAITHGSPDAPVHLDSVHANGVLEISVTNGGTPIPPEHMERLFQPFTREETRPSQHGMGLGLFIASEIARAHQGELTATSTVEKTCFTFRMPAA